MLRRRRRRRFRSIAAPAFGSAVSAPASEIDYLTLLDARDKARESLARLKKEGTTPEAAALTRNLALEAARETAPDRFVQAMRQLETLEHQHNERIKALKEFVGRFSHLGKTIKEQHAAEIQAALGARIAQLEEKKKVPGARIGEIDAEISRWKKESGDLPSASRVRAKPKSSRTHKA